MRDKLERELRRLASAVDRDEVVDHGVNAAVTAWHLVEWVWADLRDTPGLPAKVASEAGVASGRRFRLEDFKRHVNAACPELAYCRIVATNAKHLGCDLHVDDPRFATGVAPAEVRWVNDKGEPVTWVNDQGQPLRWTSAAWDLLIIADDGSRRRAVEVYERALAWWTAFIYGHQIDEPQELVPE